MNYLKGRRKKKKIQDISKILFSTLKSAYDKIHLEKKSFPRHESFEYISVGEKRKKKNVSCVRPGGPDAGGPQTNHYFPHTFFFSSALPSLSFFSIVFPRKCGYFMIYKLINNGYTAGSTGFVFYIWCILPGKLCYGLYWFLSTALWGICWFSFTTSNMK